jgi:cytochrome oxidase Cu insertion factor (SCO1/SenC/PrrC family)
MKKIFDEFGPTHPALQMVSFAIDRDDDAKRLSQYAEGNEITTDRWWFVNGDQANIRAYLKQVVKFYPVIEKPKAEQTSIVDKYQHDMRVALIDAAGHLRGMYEILNADPQFRDMARAKLRKDLLWVLREQEKAAAAPKP